MKFVLGQLFIIFLLIIICKSQPNEKQHFCRRDKCLICVGRYCTVTCRGENCNECPDGTCCTSTNCNICRGSKCCTDAECNDCVHTCLKTCEGQSTCHYNCFQKCVPIGELTQSQKNVIINTNKNYLPVNVTTVINITNEIENENYVHNPVVVNTTNVYNHTVDESLIKELTNLTFEQNEVSNNSHINNDNQFIMNDGNMIPLPPPPLKNCCTVVHPKICHPSQTYCYINKHKECSSLCTSKYIHIIKSPNAINSCVYVGAKPYFYCGNYLSIDCSICYDCDSKNNKQSCAQSAKCPSACKSSLIEEYLYNTLYIENRI